MPTKSPDLISTEMNMIKILLLGDRLEGNRYHGSVHEILVDIADFEVRAFGVVGLNPRQRLFLEFIKRHYGILSLALYCGIRCCSAEAIHEI